MRFLLIFVFTCLFKTIIYAGSEHLNFDKLSVKDGLSNSTVYFIYQDTKGFIWIGTNDGLNRFDGYNFKVYTHNEGDTFSISGDEVTSVAEDDSTNLWFAAWDGGLDYFDRVTGKFYHYLKPVKGNPTIVWTVYIDKVGNIWAGTLMKGLYLFNAQKKSFTNFIHNPSNPKSISGNYISAICEDSYGNLWIGTESDGLNLFNRKDRTFRAYKHDPYNNNSLVSNNINTIHEDEEHNLWIGSKDQGISVLSPDRKKFTNYSAGNGANNLNCNNIRSFYEDNSHTIWIGTDGGGVNYFDPVQNKFTNVKHNPDKPQSISSDVIFSITGSKEGVIWIGTFHGGMNLYDNEKYKFHPFQIMCPYGQSLGHKSIMSIFQDKEENIWIGTDGNGLIQYNRVQNTYKCYTHSSSFHGSISGNVIKSIYEDSEGNLWFGTWNNGLNLFDKTHNDFIHYKHNPSDSTSLSNNDVWDIIEDSKKNLWIGTLNGGLDLFNRKTKTFKQFRQNNIQSTNKLISDNIFSVIEDKRKGGLWICTMKGLCYCDTKKMQFTSYQHNKNDHHSLSDNDTRVIFQDSRFNLWIGTYKGGLNLYHPQSNSFTSFTVKDGLPSNTVTSIMEDNMHYLWVSTNKGISRFNPVNKTFLNFTIDDGLQNNEFNFGTTCKITDGDLLFGSIDGIDYINPSDIKTNNFIPNIIITKLYISDKEVSPGEKGSPLIKTISESKELTFSYFQSIITFEFASLNYINSRDNEYAYKLEGFTPNEKGWIYIGNRHSITFTNLDPNTYTLRIKGSNNDGKWNEQGVSLVIHILPPWWRALWFRLLVTISIVVVILGWYSRRIRTIRKQKMVLERLVKERTEELAREKDKVEKQRDEIKEMSEKVHKSDEEKLQFFTNISHEIKTPLTLILSPLEKLISHTQNNPQEKDYLSLIYRNAMILKNLVNQIMDFRKIESKNYPLQASKYNINEVLREQTSAFYDIALDKNIVFRLEEWTEPLEVWLDREKFDKIILNLLSNAFKFTSKGGLISVQVKLTHEDNEGTKEYVCIDISDTGRGIPEKDQKMIFQRFYQVYKPGGHFQGGTGVGLTIAKDLAELHHGKLSVISQEGRGSCFTLLIPIGNKHLTMEEMVISSSDEFFDQSVKLDDHEGSVLISDNGSFQVSNVPDTHVENQQEKPRILIIEDNLDMIYYIKDCLNQFYQVIEATDGKNGLVLAQSKQPILIISDIMMPEMSGLEVCRQIKTNIRTSHIPVILLTAKSSLDFKIEGLKIGADDYITKPFNSEELLARIINLIEARTRLKEKFSKELVLKPRDITLTTTDEKFLRRAIEVVENNISDPDFDVSKFVIQMNSSRTVLHLKIKELTNLPAGDFIRTLRLKRAAQLILQNSVRISEVSYMVGFSDPKYFSKCFRQHFGCSPLKYATSPSSRHDDNLIE